MSRNSRGNEPNGEIVQIHHVGHRTQNLDYPDLHETQW
jgi:hypothetical protein